MEEVEAVRGDAVRHRIELLEEVDAERLSLRSRIASVIIRLGMKLDPAAAARLDLQEEAA
jgi:hypothetical protein